MTYFDDLTLKVVLMINWGPSFIKRALNEAPEQNEALGHIDEARSIVNWGPIAH